MPRGRVGMITQAKVEKYCRKAGQILEKTGNLEKALAQVDRPIDSGGLAEVPIELLTTRIRLLIEAEESLGGGEVDTTTGSFTFGVREAYLIENGKITSPVRGATLMGNGPDVLKRIDMVGGDQAFWPGTCGKGQWVPVTSGAPTLRIAGITVGGRA